MKSVCTIWILLLLLSPSLRGQHTAVTQIGKNTAALELFIMDSPQKSSIRSQYNQLISNLKEKQPHFTNEERFLKHVFKFVHRKQLGQYKSFITLDRTFSKQKYYDCLTGTILYSLILQDLGIPFTIKEFDYHVLLIAHLSNGDVLLETTDPVGGFVTNKQDIQDRVESFISSEGTSRNNGIATNNLKYQFSMVVNNDIPISALAGLQYYNQALNHLNSMELLKAEYLISKAYNLYPSERIMEISNLISALVFKKRIAPR